MAAVLAGGALGALAAIICPNNISSTNSPAQAAEQQGQDAKDDQAGGAVPVVWQGSRLTGRCDGIWFIHKPGNFLRLNTPIHKPCREISENITGSFFATKFAVAAIVLLNLPFEFIN